MALTKINNYSNVDTNILAMQQAEDASFIGKHQVSLTNMSTTTVPAIAAGSIIEVNGSLLRADTEQSISTTDPHTSATVASGGNVYIMIDGTTKAAYFTATAPTWSDSKQGWYGLTTWANWRYVHAYMFYNGSNWIQKTLVTGEPVRAFLAQRPVYAFDQRSSFIASSNANQTISSASLTKVTFGTEYGDVMSNFASSTFSAPRNGFYCLSATIGYKETGDQGGYLRVKIQTADYQAWQTADILMSSTFNGIQYVNVSYVGFLSSGSNCEVYVQRNATAQYILQSGECVFSGVLLQEMPSV